jgi:hypothetical protein
MSSTETKPRLFIENEIMDEVYANREALAARFDYDVHKMGDYFREQEKELEKQGFRFVTPEESERRRREEE